MVKNTNLCVDLKTVMQNVIILPEGCTFYGALTRDGVDHYRFEEAVRKNVPKRNPKIFDGNYLSLVHMQNGKYKCHMKTITASPDLNAYQLATKVFNELIQAFSIID